MKQGFVMFNLSKIAVLLTVLILAAGCSSSTLDETEADAEGIEGVASGDEFAEGDTDFLPEDDFAELDNQSFDAETQDAGEDVFAEEGGFEEDGYYEDTAQTTNEFAGLEEAPLEEPMMDEPPMEEVAAVAAAESAPPIYEEPMYEEPAPAAPAMGGGQMTSYTIQAGDTLMKISFDTYGDVYQWRKIYNMNRGAIPDYNNPPVGATIQIEAPAYPVQISRNGTPYTIIPGDTLGLISSKLYGTNSKWRDLWENNRQLIRDPNKIYAGFQLYYLPDDSMTTDPAGRTPASAAQ